MRIGYCCINETLGAKGKFRKATAFHLNKKNENERYDIIKNRTRENFGNLLEIIKWNIDNNIDLYRVSSDLCVLYGHEINKYDYKQDEYVLDICSQIRKLVKDSNMRLTIHPSQFTVLNSTKKNVIDNSIKYLEYQKDLMDLLNIEVMCIHVGGKQGGVEEGKQRFIDTYNNLLNDSLKSVICLENDDKSYNTEDTLDLCEKLNIPMIFDWHHDRVLKSSKDNSEYMDRIIDTWGDRVPLAHLSSSADESKLIASHHEYIDLTDYFLFCRDTKEKFDVEFECKKKDLAVNKIKEYL